MQIHDYFEIVGMLVITIVGGLGFGWFRILKETNGLLKEQNSELRDENTELKEHRVRNIGTLAKMQGQIDELKNIPLVNIDVTLKNLAKFNEAISITNERILKQLQMTADIAEQDRPNLTHRSQKEVNVIKKDNKEK